MKSLARPRWTSLLIGVVAAAAYFIAFFATADKSLFFRAYLFAFLFCLGLSLGSLCLLMLHNLTGGQWGYRIRPTLNAASLTLPLLVLLFIPICFHLPDLYPWARAEAASDATLLHRHIYLNIPFFIARAGFYFAVWIILAFLCTRARPASRGLSAAGLILYLFTMTHAGFDWIMSRDTEFYSTAFGLVVTLGQTLSALALAIVLLHLLPVPAPPPPPTDTEPRFPLLNDLGNVLITIVILWAYVAFMQFLVIWMGNSRDDNHWYLLRGIGGAGSAALAWRIIGLLLIVFHFFVPFFILLFRSAKQYRPVLAAIAWTLLVAHLLNEYWLVAPSDNHAPQFNPHWLDPTAVLALLGLWLFLFFTLFVHRQKTIDSPLSYEGAPAHG